MVTCRNQSFVSFRSGRYSSLNGEAPAFSETVAPHLQRLRCRALPRLHEDAVCARTGLRRSDGTHSGTPLRAAQGGRTAGGGESTPVRRAPADRKSTRLNSSHG